MNSSPIKEIADADGHLWHSPQYVRDWIREREEESTPLLTVRHHEELQIVLEAVAREGLSPRVLELGVGWGRFSGALLREFPDASVVAIDYSKPMLDAARVNLVDVLDRVELMRRDLRAAGAIDSIQGSFDLVFCSQTLHHFEPRTLLAIFAQIREVLRPGATFLNIDRVGKPSTMIARVFYSWVNALPASNRSPWKTRRRNRVALALDRALMGLMGSGTRRPHDVMLFEHLDLMRSSGLEVDWKPLSPQRFLLRGQRND